MVLSHRQIRELVQQHYDDPVAADALVGATASGEPTVSYFRALHDLHRHGKNSILFRAIEQHGDITPIGEDETERSFLSRVQDFAADIARGIYENVADIISRLGWLVILSVKTIPSFVMDIFNAASRMATDSGPALGRAIRTVAAKAAQFWDYIRTLFAFRDDDAELSDGELDDIQELENGMTWLRSVIRTLGTWTATTIARGIVAVASAVKELVESTIENLAAAANEMASAVASIPAAAASSIRGAHRTVVKWLMLVLSGFAAFQQMASYSREVVKSRMDAYLVVVERQLKRMTSVFSALSPLPQLAGIWSTLLDVPVLGAILRFFKYTLSTLASGVAFIASKLRWLTVVYAAFTAPFRLVAGYIYKGIPELTRIITRIMQERVAPGFDFDNPINRLTRLIPIATKLSRDKQAVPSAMRRNRLATAASNTKIFLRAIKEHQDDYMETTFGTGAARMFEGPRLSAEMLTRTYFGEDPSTQDLDRLSRINTGMPLNVYVERLSNVYGEMMASVMEIVITYQEAQDDDSLFAENFSRVGVNLNPFSWIFGSGQEKEKDETLGELYERVMGSELPVSAEGLTEALKLVEQRQKRLIGKQRLFQAIQDMSLGLADEESREIAAAGGELVNYNDKQLEFIKEQLEDILQDSVDLEQLINQIPARRLNRQLFILAKTAQVTLMTLFLSGVIVAGVGYWYWLSRSEERTEARIQAYDSAITKMGGGTETDQFGNRLLAAYRSENPGPIQSQSDINRFIGFTSVEVASVRGGRLPKGTTLRDHAANVYDRWKVTLGGTEWSEPPDSQFDSKRVAWWKFWGKDDRPIEEQRKSFYTSYLSRLHGFLQERQLGLDKRLRAIDAPPSFTSNIARNSWSFVNKQWAAYSKQVRVDDLTVKNLLAKLGAGDVAYLENVIEFLSAVAQVAMGVVGTGLFFFLGTVNVLVDLIYGEDLQKFRRVNSANKAMLFIAVQMAALWGPVIKNVLQSAGRIKANRDNAILGFLGPLSAVLSLMSLWMAPGQLLSMVFSGLGKGVSKAAEKLRLRSTPQETLALEGKKEGLDVLKARKREELLEQREQDRREAELRKRNARQTQRIQEERKILQKQRSATVKPLPAPPGPRKSGAAPRKSGRALRRKRGPRKRVVDDEE